MESLDGIFRSKQGLVRGSEQALDVKPLGLTLSLDVGGKDLVIVAFVFFGH